MTDKSPEEIIQQEFAEIEKHFDEIGKIAEQFADLKTKYGFLEGVDFIRLRQEYLAAVDQLTKGVK